MTVATRRGAAARGPSRPGRPDWAAGTMRGRCPRIREGAPRSRRRVRLAGERGRRRRCYRAARASRGRELSLVRRAGTQAERALCSCGHPIAARPEHAPVVIDDSLPAKPVVIAESQDEPPFSLELTTGLLILLCDVPLIVDGPVEEYGDVRLRAAVGEVGSDVQSVQRSPVLGRAACSHRHRGTEGTLAPVRCCCR